MRKVLGLLVSGMLCSIPIYAQAQSTTKTQVWSIMRDFANSPNGPAFLNASGYITAPSQGAVDAATVGGSPLSNIIPALQKANRLADVLRTSNIDVAGGVAGLNAQKQISDEVIGSIAQAYVASGITSTDLLNRVIALENSSLIDKSTLVLKDQANVAGGYALLDANGDVTVPVVGNVGSAMVDSTTKVSDLSDRIKNTLVTSQANANNGYVSLDGSGNATFSNTLYFTNLTKSATMKEYMLSGGDMTFDNTGHDFIFKGNTSVTGDFSVNGSLNLSGVTNVNSANGFSVLDANGAVINTINSPSVSGQTFVLPVPGDEVKFATSAASSPTYVRVGYDSSLNTLYFNSGSVGSTYTFDGKVIVPAIALANSPIFAPGYYAPTPLHPESTSPTVSISNTNTVAIGGQDTYRGMHLEANCLGGVASGNDSICHRLTSTNKALTAPIATSYDTLPTSTNFESYQNFGSPVDVLGGNQVQSNSNGSKTVIGTSVTLAKSVAAGATSIYITPASKIACGVANPCVITASGLTTSTGSAASTATGSYDGTVDASGNLRFTLTNGYVFSQALDTNATVTLMNVARDGVSYGVVMQSDGSVRVYPKLSATEENLITKGRGLFTNMINGMVSTIETGSVDLPNYYYGYTYSVTDDSSTNSTVIVTKSYNDVTDAAALTGWTTVKEAGLNKTATHIPSLTGGDVYDLTYSIPSGSSSRTITNGHRYKALTLFVGAAPVTRGTASVISLDTTQPDTSTRSIGDLHRSVVTATADYEVKSLGLTIDSESNKKLSKDSTILTLQNNQTAPTGLRITGVQTSGREIYGDGGFTTFNAPDTYANSDETQIMRLGSWSMGTDGGALNLFTETDTASKGTSLGTSLRLAYITNPLSTTAKADLTPLCITCQGHAQLVWAPGGSIDAFSIGYGLNKAFVPYMTFDKTGTVSTQTVTAPSFKSTGGVSFDNGQITSDGNGNLTVRTINGATSGGGGGTGSDTLETSTYAQLIADTTESIGTRRLCTDCTSWFTAVNTTTYGIEVLWNNHNWTDTMGNPIITQ